MLGSHGNKIVNVVTAAAYVVNLIGFPTTFLAPSLVTDKLGFSNFLRQLAQSLRIAPAENVGKPNPQGFLNIRLL